MPPSGTSLVRIVTERLLLLLFWITRTAFLAQGLAVGMALLAASAAGGLGAPSWLATASRSSLHVGGTLFATGILLGVLARRPLAPPVDGDVRPGSPWPALLGLCLALLPAVAYAGASGLFELWREIWKLLAGVGFWAELRQSGPYSGIIVIPVLVALFVPALEATAAFFLIAAPLGMLALLLTRSRLFRKLFAMLLACQAGLVLAGLLGADAFSRLATVAIAAMSAAEDVEVRRYAEEFRHAERVLASTAVAFVAPMVGHLVWLPVVLSARQRPASPGG